MAPLALDVRDEPDAARIVFIRRVIKSLRRWQMWLLHSAVMNELLSYAKRVYLIDCMRRAHGTVMRAAHRFDDRGEVRVRFLA